MVAAVSKEIVKVIVVSNSETWRWWAWRQLESWWCWLWCTKNRADGGGGVQKNCGGPKRIVVVVVVVSSRIVGFGCGVGGGGVQ